MSFAEIEAYKPASNVTTTLFEREPNLLKEVLDCETIPPNGDVRIEDLTEEDMELPIDFI